MPSYDELLAEAQSALDRGVASESPDELRRRAELVIGDTGRAKNLIGRETGVFDWASKTLEGLEAAIRSEICDPSASGLNKKYADILAGALKPDGIVKLAAVVLSIAKVINPALAVSSVGVYVAVWLLKVGLNKWCSVSPAENAG